MKDYRKSMAVAFVVLVWTGVLVCLGAHFYSRITSSDGFQGFNFKTVDEIIDANP